MPNYELRKNPKTKEAILTFDNKSLLEVIVIREMLL